MVLPVIFLIAGLFLGSVVVLLATYQEVDKISGGELGLYRYPLVDRVSFSASGEITAIDKERITIEREGEELTAKISEDLRVFLFTLVEIENGEEEFEEEFRYDGPEIGTIDDIKIGLEVSIFGIQEEESLIVESISINR